MDDRTHAARRQMMRHAPEQDQTFHDVREPLNEQVVALLLAKSRTFHAFVAQRVGSDTVADDLLQQSLQKALEHPAMARETPRIFAWFSHILRSTLVDYYRARAAEEKKGAHWGQAVIAQGRTHVPALDEPQAVPCTCVEGLLPTLKPSYAELLQRIDLGEEPVATVAGALGITEKNLYVRLHRARQVLKRQLERTCGTCTEGGCLDCTCTADNLPVSLEEMGERSVCTSQ